MADGSEDRMQLVGRCYWTTRVRFGRVALFGVGLIDPRIDETRVEWQILYQRRCNGKR